MSWVKKNSWKEPGETHQLLLLCHYTTGICETDQPHQKTHQKHRPRKIMPLEKYRLWPIRMLKNWFQKVRLYVPESVDHQCLFFISLFKLHDYIFQKFSWWHCHLFKLTLSTLSRPFEIEDFIIFYQTANFADHVKARPWPIFICK